MTNRKVASLTSGLLARKGTARPADLPAEEEEKGWLAATPPVSLAADSAEHATPDRNPAREVASVSDAAEHATEAPRDFRAYAWPTQGAPTARVPAADEPAANAQPEDAQPENAPADEDLAMPTPPSDGDVEDAMAAMRRRTTMRRLAISGIAAAVVAGLVVIVVRDGRKDAARLTAAGGPPAVTATPALPAASAPAVAEAKPPPAAAATPAPHIAAPLPPEKPVAETAASGKAERPAMTEAARQVRDIAPAAGTPLPPRADMELTPRIPPLPTEQVAKLHEASPAPEAAAMPKAPAVESPAEKLAAVPAAPLPKSRPAAKHSAHATVAKAVIGGHYAVQIASLGSKPRAAAERTRLAKRLGAVLGGRALIIEEATVAGHGTVYRIRAHGYQNLAAARKACAAIKGRGLGCFVVRL